MKKLANKIASFFIFVIIQTLKKYNILTLKNIKTNLDKLV